MTGIFSSQPPAQRSNMELAKVTCSVQLVTGTPWDQANSV